MRYAEVLSLTESIAGMILRLAQARQHQMAQEQAEPPPSLPAVAGEILRLVETRVGVELMMGKGEA